MAVINPFAEDFDDDLVEGMEAAYKLVLAYAEKLHGPMDKYEAGGRDILTGERTGIKLGGKKEDICNESREMGGAFQRFFSAHWELSDDLSRWNGPYLSAWPALWMRYGWALCQLQTEIPELTAADPGDIEFEVPDDVEEAA